jgi:hypothetical protein
MDDLLDMAFPGVRSPAQAAAEWLQVKPSTVYRWKKTGNPPHSAVLALKARALYGPEALDFEF